MKEMNRPEDKGQKPSHFRIVEIETRLRIEFLYPDGSRGPYHEDLIIPGIPDPNWRPAWTLAPPNPEEK